MGDAAPDGEAVDVEEEKTKSWELGQIKGFKRVAEDLRERAGELYAQNDDRRSKRRAEQLKELAQEYEEQAAEERDHWEDKYDE